MFIKVMLERIYEVDYEFEDLGIKSIDEITDMDGLDMLDDHASTITTEFKSISLMTESEVELLRAEEEDRPDELHRIFMSP